MDYSGRAGPVLNGSNAGHAAKLLGSEVRLNGRKGRYPPVMFRSGLVVTLAIALLGACSNSEPPSQLGGSEDVSTEITQLPSVCGAATSSGASPEIAFTANERLYVTDASGQNVACLGEVGPPAPLTWGPGGENFALTQFEYVDLLIAGEKRQVKGPGEYSPFLGFSRPDSEYVLFVGQNGDPLEKVSVTGGDREDISFLRRHDEAVYDPTGREIAVIGEPSDEPYGIFIVDDEGRQPHRIVTSKIEDEFYALTYSADGETLYYVRDLHDAFELHSIPARSKGKPPRPTVMFTSEQPFRPYVSTYGDGIAIREGDCETGFETSIIEGGGATPVVDDGDSQPIGWTSDGALVTAVADDLCAQGRNLNLYFGDAENRELLIRGVFEAAVRPAG